MTKLPPDTNRGLFVVSAPESLDIYPTDVEADESISQTQQHTDRHAVYPVGQWAAYIQLDWPVDVERHPNVGRHLMRKLDRVCCIDHQAEHLGLTYALLGDSIEEAEADADETLNEIVDWLGLGRAAVKYGTILSLARTQK